MLPPSPLERRAEARKLALQLMAQHGLHGWNFALNRHKRSMGVCRYARKVIELSAHFVERNGIEAVRDTILHEIAHALVGPGHGHGVAWRRKCLEVGARPVRCGEAEMPRGRWQARCEGCGKDFHRYRRPKRLDGWYCPSCGPDHGRLLWRAGGPVGR